MSGTQLIWIVLSTFTFIVTILTTPKLTFNSQNDTTNKGENTRESCPQEFTDYCMHLVVTVYLKEQQTAACKCLDLYGGKRCETFLRYHKSASEKCLHQMLN